MSDLELIFTMLGERVTTEISQKENPDTFTKNKQMAQHGGNVAGVVVLFLLKIFYRIPISRMIL